ncbi:MAG: ribosome hibernation-promoting factor, HPF/YfiA family [Sphingomonadales bacterium]
MEIRVSGHQVDTGDALRRHVEERLNAISRKYLARPVSSQTTFGKGPHDHNFTCDIVMYVRNGVVLKASGRAADAHPAFDGAADKIEKQLRRYMRRLKDHHAPVGGETAEAPQAEAAYTIFAGGAEEEEPVDNPPVIAETRVDIPDATVSDAVMQLDLRNTNALLFRNLGTGRFNMVYRRGDGTIGWVEPQRD